MDARNVIALFASLCVACAVSSTDDVSGQMDAGMMPVDGSGGCQTGWQICSQKCVDARTDSNNCGLCGRTCQMGWSCANGQCMPTGGCPNGTKLCGMQCLDTTTDKDNCGSCNNKCGGGMKCVDSKCVVDCQAPTKDCGGVCTDTTMDDANCGMCGTACPMSSSCMASICVCTNMLTLCSNTCVDTKMDNANCGMCGKQCMNNEQCVAGTCKTAPAKTIVFVTSMGWVGGGLGGLSGADQKCQTLAQAQSLSGSWVAWLSDSKTAADARIAHWQTPYVLVDGTTQIASDWSGLTSGTISHAIDHNEKNMTSALTVWTNTNTNGTMYSGTVCGDWANTSGTVNNFRFGMATLATAAWTLNPQSTYSGSFCNSITAGLYCFQQ